MLLQNPVGWKANINTFANSFSRSTFKSVDHLTGKESYNRSEMGIFKGTDWIRRILSLLLVASLIFVVRHSFTEMFANKVAFTQTVKSSSALLYPSVTICPYLMVFDYVDNNITLSEQFERLPHVKELVNSVEHSYRNNQR
jgi:hypothetical protein